MSAVIESTSSLSTWETIRRGLRISPEMRAGLGVTLGLALLTTVGRVVVPFVVQQTTDHGLLAPGGPDVGLVWRTVALGAFVVTLTALCAYAVNVRLFRASEGG